MTVHSLTQRADFLRLRHGSSYASKSFKIFYLDHAYPSNNLSKHDSCCDLYIGYTVTKKLFKKAVDRNRVKRRFRGLTLYMNEQISPVLGAPILMNFLARHGALTTSFEVLKKEIDGFIATYQEKGTA